MVSGTNVMIGPQDILEGELYSMPGPSGCGKTTTLRMIGRRGRTAGKVELGGADVTDISDRGAFALSIDDHVAGPSTTGRS